MAFGFSGSIKGVFLTRGKDAWTGNVLLSGSARLGFDIGLSATEENGCYWGWDPRKASMDQLLEQGKICQEVGME